VKRTAVAVVSTATVAVRSASAGRGDDTRVPWR
jgi:hypothetical protein